MISLLILTIRYDAQRFVASNEAVEKLLKKILTTKWVGGETLPDTAIVDPGAFYECQFSSVRNRNIFIGVFLQPQRKVKGCRAYAASLLDAGWGIYV